MCVSLICLYVRRRRADNNTGAAGAQALATALQSNRTLTALDLGSAFHSPAVVLLILPFFLGSSTCSIFSFLFLYFYVRVESASFLSEIFFVILLLFF